MLRGPLVHQDVGPPVEIEADRLEPSGFGQLYEQHRLSVCRYLRARTRSDEEALDLAATTFERAFTHLHRFRRRDGGVQAWLLRIARNVAIDAHRRHRPTVELGSADAHLVRSPWRVIGAGTRASRSSTWLPGFQTTSAKPFSSDTPVD